MENEKESMGSRIKKCRKARGLTQGELAKLVGASTSAIMRYEKDPDDPDYTEPKVSTFKAIASTLHVSEDYLLCKTDKSKEISVSSFAIPQKLQDLVYRKVQMTYDMMDEDDLDGYGIDSSFFEEILSKPVTISVVKKLMETFYVTMEGLFDPNVTLRHPPIGSVLDDEEDMPTDEDLINYVMTFEDTEEALLEKYGINSSEFDSYAFTEFIESVLKVYFKNNEKVVGKLTDKYLKLPAAICSIITENDYRSLIMLYESMDYHYRPLALSMLRDIKEFSLWNKEP